MPLAPALRHTPPLLPLAAAPLSIDTDPDVPQADEPDAKDTEPLAPVEAASAEPIATLPLSLDAPELPPLQIATLPPADERLLLRNFQLTLPKRV